MAMPRKNPPKDAEVKIEQMASEGFSPVGIAKHFNVSTSTFRRWLSDHEEIQEAFERGRETERQALHALLKRDAVANKSANVNAIFLLKARHGYRESDPVSQNVNVAVATSPVLLVKDHGSDDQWEAMAAAQQSKLISNGAAPPVVATPMLPSEATAQPTLPAPTDVPGWSRRA